MRQNRIRRMSSTKTIGFADNIRRTKPLFSKIKQIYGNELEILNSKKNKKNLSIKKLTEKEKLEIRERIRKQIKKEQLKELTIIITVILIALGIFILVRYFQ